MFSKTYTSNLSFIPNNYSQKFKAFSNLYTNDLSFIDSYLYGLKRQHNYLSSTSLLNNQSTFLNMSSINKFINFNFQSNLELENNDNYYNNSFFKKNQNISTSDNSLRVSNLIKNINHNYSLNSLNQTVLYPDSTSLINDDSDKKKTQYPLYKLFNAKLSKNDFNNFTNLNKLNLLTESSIIDENNEFRNSIFNEQVTYKNLTMFSPNQSVSLSDRYIRNFVQNTPSISHFNYSLNLNTLNNYLNQSNLNPNFNNNNLFNLSNNS
jgi:hypothetical protein